MQIYLLRSNFKILFSLISSGQNRGLPGRFLYFSVMQSSGTPVTQGNWFGRPYPAEFAVRPSLIRAGLFGLFVAVFLGYFEPFGISRLPERLLLPVVTTFGCITFACIVLVAIGLPRLMPGAFAEERWTVGREFAHTMLNFILIGTANAVAIYLWDFTNQPFSSLLISIQGGTFAVGIIPVLFFLYYDQNRFLRRHLAKAGEANSQLGSLSAKAEPEEVVAAAPAPLMTLLNESGKPELQLPPASLLCIRSDGNYLEVYYRVGEELQKHLLRNRIKSVLPALSAATFVQCHRSYVVSLQDVRQVMGNARGYELQVEGLPFTVPVSRGKASEVLELLQGQKANQLA